MAIVAKPFFDADVESEAKGIGTAHHRREADFSGLRRPLQRIPEGATSATVKAIREGAGAVGWDR